MPFAKLQGISPHLWPTNRPLLPLRAPAIRCLQEDSIHRRFLPLPRHHRRNRQPLRRALQVASRAMGRRRRLLRLMRDLRRRP